MVAARERFLGAGRFDPLAEALAEAAGARAAGAPPASSTSAPAPAGTSRACSMRSPGRAVSRSISRSPPCAAPLASIRTSRPSPATSGGRFRCGTPWPPWSSTCSPRAARPEIARVLAPGGVAVVVTPQPDHLRELAQPLGLLTVDEDKETRLADRLDPALAISDRRDLTWTLRLDHAGARRGRDGPQRVPRLARRPRRACRGLPQLLEVTAAVTITLATAAAPRARPPAPAAGASAADRLRTPPASRPPRSPGDTG